MIPFHHTRSVWTGDKTRLEHRQAPSYTKFIFYGSAEVPQLCSNSPQDQRDGTIERPQVRAASRQRPLCPLLQAILAKPPRPISQACVYELGKAFDWPEL